MPIGRKQQIDIETYYIRYGPMVLRRCRKLLKNEENAFDAMQDVFVQLMTHQENLIPTYPSSLLYRIATNICLNKIRSQRTRQAIIHKDILVNTSLFDKKEFELDIHSLLEYILKDENELTHQIAVRYFVDGMKLGEIAREVRLSVSGVHKRLKELRARLSKKGGSL